MEELDKEFVEPVVLGHLPFEMDADLAREAVLRTHHLVLELTAGTDEGSQRGRDDEVHADSGPAAHRPK
jgi:hypothetical protein